VCDAGDDSHVELAVVVEHVHGGDHAGAAMSAARATV
jgi:hypothetical protein